MTERGLGSWTMPRKPITAYLLMFSQKLFRLRDLWRLPHRRQVCAADPRPRVPSERTRSALGLSDVAGRWRTGAAPDVLHAACIASPSGTRLDSRGRNDTALCAALRTYRQAQSRNAHRVPLV